VEKAGRLRSKPCRSPRAIGDKQGEGWALAYSGIYYFFNGELSTAQTYLSQSLSYGRALPGPKSRTYSLTQTGNTYRDKGSLILPFSITGGRMKQFSKAERLYSSL